MRGGDPPETAWLPLSSCLTATCLMVPIRKVGDICCADEACSADAIDALREHSMQFGRADCTPYSTLEYGYNIALHTTEIGR